MDFTIKPPIFLSIPALVTGMPVALVKLRFNAVIPMALFREKLSPGIFVLLIFFYLFDYKVTVYMIPPPMILNLQ